MNTNRKPANKGKVFFVVNGLVVVVYINKIQQDAAVSRYLFTAKSLSTCFGCPSHPSSGVPI